MIGLITAIEPELIPIREQMEDLKEEEIGRQIFYLGKIKGKEVVLTQAGIGKVNAALCTEIMILKYGVEKIINTGIAGALTRGFKIGELVISSDCVEHDMDTSPIGDPLGFLSGPGLNRIDLPADENLIREITEIVEKLGYKYRVGRIATGDQFIADNRIKARIVKEFDALCCEMEGGAIAHVCYVNKIPFIIIRSISDGETEDGAIMEYQSFGEQVAKISASVVLNYLMKEE